PYTTLFRSIAEFYPDVEVRGDIGDYDTLLSIEKARRPLGYRPGMAGATPLRPSPKNEPQLGTQVPHSLASRWSRPCSDVRVYLRSVDGSGQRDHPGGPMRRDESSPRARDHAAAATVKGAMPGPRVWLIHALERA